MRRFDTLWCPIARQVAFKARIFKILAAVRVDPVTDCELEIVKYVILNITGKHFYNVRFSRF